MAVKAAVLLESDYEDLEYWYPYLRPIEAGIKPETVAPKKETYKSKHGYPATADVTAAAAAKKSYGLVVIPGGWAPDRMRRDDDMVRVVRKAARAGKVVAAVCHGGSMLVSAGCARGVRLTSVRAIRDDLVAAGARWQDRPVMRDGNFITAQGPGDLPEFMRAILSALRA